MLHDLGLRQVSNCYQSESIPLNYSHLVPGLMLHAVTTVDRCSTKETLSTSVVVVAWIISRLGESIVPDPQLSRGVCEKFREIVRSLLLHDV